MLQRRNFAFGHEKNYCNIFHVRTFDCISDFSPNLNSALEHLMKVVLN